MKNPSGKAGALNVDIKYLVLQPDIITDKPPTQTTDIAEFILPQISNLPHHSFCRDN